ncbi:unnamed protein product [Sphagnum balticum]
MSCVQSLDVSQTDIRFTAESPIRAQRFLCLLSLRLRSVEASALQLQSFVASCKSLKSLSLDCMRFRDTELTVNLTSSSLKSFSLKGMSLDSRHGNVVLEASSLESIRVLESSFRSLKLVKKGARVRSVRIARFHSLTIDNVENSGFGPWKQQHRLSSVRRGRTEELRPLCLHCNRRCSFKTIFDIEEVTIVGHPTLCWSPQYETIACLFPLFTYLGLSYTLVGRLSYRLDPQMTVEGHLWGSTVLEKVQTLELEDGPKLDNEFHLTMGEGLKRCPNLRRDCL